VIYCRVDQFMDLLNSAPYTAATCRQGTELLKLIAQQDESDARRHVMFLMVRVLLSVAVPIIELIIAMRSVMEA